MKNITSAEATVSASLDGIHLYSGSFDLCSEIKNVNLQCPLSVKQYSIEVKTKIPEIAPRVPLIHDYNYYDVTDLFFRAHTVLKRQQRIRMGCSLFALLQSIN